LKVNPLMKKVGILYHPLNESARTLAEELKRFLPTRGVVAWVCSAWEEENARCQLDSTELILSIGGDGTILRAAQVAVTSDIPITGINLGNLGFMTELKADEVATKLIGLLDGRGWLDKRSTLEAQFSTENAAIGESRVYLALNDVVLARGAIVRMINIDTEIDGEHLASYRADGLILATATGSTGYTLAAGGPILHPQANEFVMTPILPHLSSSHSLVLPGASIVKLSLKTASPATLSIDGHINLSVSGGTIITVKRSSYTIKFLRVKPQTSFYTTLEQKLKGKQTQ
jgi:NAD+ kinase